MSARLKNRVAALNRRPKPALASQKKEDASTGGVVVPTVAGTNEASSVYARVGDAYNAAVTRLEQVAIAGASVGGSAAVAFEKTRPAGLLALAAVGVHSIGTDRIKRGWQLTADIPLNLMHGLNQSTAIAGSKLPTVTNTTLTAAENVAAEFAKTMTNTTQEFGGAARTTASEIAKVPAAVTEAVKDAAASVASSVAGGAGGTVERVGATVEKVTYALLAVAGLYVVYKVTSHQSTA